VGNKFYFFSALNLPMAVESGSRKIKNSRNPDELDTSTQAWNPVRRVWSSKFLLSSIQPMPQYETSFHLKMMTNDKNLASGKSLKQLEKILFL
jgi:hypothetical protein